jgi:hypothetical protein
VTYNAATLTRVPAGRLEDLCGAVLILSFGLFGLSYAGLAAAARNLQLDLWHRNAVWLQRVLLALDLVGWAQVLLLADVQPKTSRYRLWHVARRISRHARRLRLRLQRIGPCAADLVRAFTRLDALPVLLNYTPQRPLPIGAGPGP